jgi:hypothetical protein
MLKEIILTLLSKLKKFKEYLKNKPPFVETVRDLIHKEFHKFKSFHKDLNLSIILDNAKEFYNSQNSYLDAKYLLDVEHMLDVNKNIWQNIKYKNLIYTQAFTNTLQIFHQGIEIVELKPCPLKYHSNELNPLNNVDNINNINNRLIQQMAQIIDSKILTCLESMKYVDFLNDIDQFLLGDVDFIIGPKEIAKRVEKANKFFLEDTNLVKLPKDIKVYFGKFSSKERIPAFCPYILFFPSKYFSYNSSHSKYCMYNKIHWINNQTLEIARKEKMWFDDSIELLEQEN